MSIFLQIFLYVDVFIIGAVFAVALRHGYAHYHPAPKPKPTKPLAQTNHIPQEVREKMLIESQQKFQHVLDHSADQLDHELSVTAQRINTTVSKLASDILTKELTSFQAMFKSYQEKAIKELEDSKSQTETYKAELKEEIKKEVETEKARLIDEINNRLSDAIMSFLTEAMQYDIDLGSQSDYLLSQLELHKEEFIKAVKDED